MIDIEDKLRKKKKQEHKAKQKIFQNAKINKYTTEHTENGRPRASCV